MRKERKSRAKKSSTSRAGRPKLTDPRRTNHLMLYTSEREACDARAKRLGLGFSTWARLTLLAAVAEEMAAGKVPADSLEGVFLMLTRALSRELRDLPEAKRRLAIERLTRAFMATHDVDEADELMDILSSGLEPREVDE